MASEAIQEQVLEPNPKPETCEPANPRTREPETRNPKPESNSPSNLELETQTLEAWTFAENMMGHTTRWSTTLASKVNLPHAINFRALCGANLVTYPADFWRNKTRVAHRVG